MKTPLFFSPKDPSEVIVLSVDTTALLEPAETIVSALWQIESESIPDEVTTGMFIGTTDFSAAPIIRQKITGGIHGGSYLHRVKITTSTGRIIVEGIRQAVRKGA